MSRRLPIQSKDEKIRKCLKCGAEFVSTWKGHRICYKCDKRKDREEAERPILRIRDALPDDGRE